MHSFLRKGALTLFFLLLIFYILADPALSLHYALTGLTLWFHNMIPTLLPFMIVTGMMIQLNITSAFVQVVKPFLGPLFFLDDDCLYAIVIGFLCGFPMGARTVAQMYRLGKISKEKASLLLAFCNNIGPVYFTGFVMAALKIEHKFLCLFGMYALPFCYGLLLRHTIYRKSIPYAHAAFPKMAKNRLSSEKLLDTIDGSITAGLLSIAKLGGYMVLFNLFHIIPFHLLREYPGWLGKIHCILEITSGIRHLGASSPLYVLVLLPFGGFSCIAQTYSMIHGTGLSLRQYVFHKTALTGVTFVYYLAAVHMAGYPL